MSIGNYQFAQLPFGPAPYQRMGGEIVDGGLERDYGALRGLKIFVAQERESALDVIQGSR